MTGASQSAVPDAVRAAYGFTADHTVEPLAGGLINRTYLVAGPGDGPVAVLQRLHPVFGAEVNLDLEAITAHLAAAGLDTPRLVRTAAGAPWVEHDGRIWRALGTVAGGEVISADQL